MTLLLTIAVICCCVFDISMSKHVMHMHSAACYR